MALWFGRIILYTDTEHPICVSNLRQVAEWWGAVVQHSAYASDIGQRARCQCLKTYIILICFNFQENMSLTEAFFVQTISHPQLRTGTSLLSFTCSIPPFHFVAQGLIPCIPEAGTSTPIYFMGFPHLFLWKKQPLKEGKTEAKQFFTYTIDSLSDRNIKLLCKQSPAQAAMRDLSYYSFP